MSRSEKETRSPEHKPVRGVSWTWDMWQLSQERLSEQGSLAVPPGIWIREEGAAFQEMGSCRKRPEDRIESGIYLAEFPEQEDIKE